MRGFKVATFGSPCMEWLMLLCLPCKSAVLYLNVICVVSWIFFGLVRFLKPELQHFSVEFENALIGVFTAP